MSGGKGAGGSQTVNTDPWVGSQSFISDILANAKSMFDNLGNSTYTPRNDWQNLGQSLTRSYADQLPTQIAPYQQAAQARLQGPGANDNPFGINPALQGNMNLFGPNSGATGQGIDANPYNINTAIQQGLVAPNSISQNPVLEQYAQAATRPLQQQLDLQTMPGIRSMFGASQPGGGSRQGIAEGVAQGLTNQGIGDTRANIFNNAYNQSLQQQQGALGAATQNYNIGANRQDNALSLANNAYGQGLNAQTQALSLYPQVLASGGVPGQIISGQGDVIQADQNAAQMDPYNRFGLYQNAVNGVPSYGSQTTSGGGGNSLLGGLGGAATGQSIAKMMGSTSPWGAILGGLAGLLG